jgi:hypothetical protein
MATTLTAIGSPKRITLGNSDVLTQVNFPAFANAYRVQFITNAGKIARAGADAGAIGADFETVAAGTAVERDLQYRPGIVTAQVRYFASGTEATVVEVTPLRKVV